MTTEWRDVMPLETTDMSPRDDRHVTSRRLTCHLEATDMPPLLPFIVLHFFSEGICNYGTSYKTVFENVFFLGGNGIKYFFLLSYFGTSFVDFE